jgi:hypothetical protein
MSTLELENIKHPDNSGDNIELAADGSINVKAPNNQGIKITPTGASSTNYLDFYDTGGGPYGRLGYDHNASAMTFRTYTSEKMRLTYEGNLGLGTTTPLRKLHVASAGDTHIILQSTNAVDDSEIFEIGAGANSASKVDLTFRTRLNSGSGGAERMRITNDGYVTTPNQPGFQFWNNGSDFAISAGGKVTCFYAGDHNVGSHFDATNQRFTAPVSGYYLFGGHLRIGAPGKIRVARFQIYLNGSRLRDLMSVGGTNDYDGSSGYDHPGDSGNAVQYLNTGDYVEMYVDAELSSSNTVYIQGGSTSNRKSYWFGHLLG